MNCEPLKNKKEHIKNTLQKSTKTTENDYFQGFTKGVDDSFELFATYIELYTQYKNNVKRLMQEQKPVWKQWVKYYEKQTNVNKSEYIVKYNTWLFKYMFYDANNKKSDDFLSL